VLPALRRFFFVQVETSCTQTVAVKVGSGSVTVSAGYRYLFWSNGTTNHLAMVSGTDPSGLDFSGAMPPGGSSGEVLKKLSNADYDFAWGTDEIGGSVPAGGTTTQVLVKQSNADFDADWENPSGAGGTPWDWNPPAASYFTTSGGSGTHSLTDDSDVGLIFEHSWTGSSNLSSYYVKNITNSTWTMVAKLHFAMRDNANLGSGIMLYESGTNKRYQIGYHNRTFKVLYYTALTGSFVNTESNHTPAIAGNPGTAFGGAYWIKIDLGITAANTYTVWISGNGKAWRLVYSFTKTTRFTTAADRLGIQTESNMAAVPSGGESVFMTIPYWSDNA
jgi:hypothetical protein